MPGFVCIEGGVVVPAVMSFPLRQDLVHASKQKICHVFVSCRDCRKQLKQVPDWSDAPFWGICQFIQRLHEPL